MPRGIGELSRLSPDLLRVATSTLLPCYPGPVRMEVSMNKSFVFLVTVCALACSADLQESADARSVRAQFDRHHAQWLREADAIKVSSNTYDYLRLPAFRSIVAMDRPVLPLLRSRLEQDKGLDFMLAFAVVEIEGWD